MTEAELLPCPFCGGEADFAIGKKGDGTAWRYVECNKCASMADNETIWNRRAPSPEQRERKER